MCGRYRLARKKEILNEYFGAAPEENEEPWEPRYNIAPTQPAPVVRQDAREPVRTLSLLRWGFPGNLINARSETAAKQPAFRDALKSRRCLVPADGFYEWMKSGKTRQPYCFEVVGTEPGRGDLFAFAGLWNRDSFTILTTAPNAVAGAIHDRMPVILDPDSYDLWLDPGFRDVAGVSDLLKPYAKAMRSFPVSARVNNVVNDDAECSRPAEPPVIQHNLFT